MNPSTLTVGKLVVTCFCRSEEPAVRYFVVREFDAKVLRSAKSKGLNEQAIRASIRQVILDHKLKSEPATKSEIQILKQEGLIGKRAPSCALLSGSDMIKLLLAFDKVSEARELKAAITRSVKADPETAEMTPDLPDIDAFLEQAGVPRVSSSFASSSTSAETSPQKQPRTYRKRKAAEPALDFHDSVEGKRERKRTAKAQALENGAAWQGEDEEEEDYVSYAQDSKTREISHILANIPRSRSNLDILSDTLCALHAHEMSAKSDSNFGSHGQATIAVSTDPERKSLHVPLPQPPQLPLTLPKSLPLLNIKGQASALRANSPMNGLKNLIQVAETSSQLPPLPSSLPLPSGKVSSSSVSLSLPSLPLNIGNLNGILGPPGPSSGTGSQLPALPPLPTQEVSPMSALFFAANPYASRASLQLHLQRAASARQEASRTPMANYPEPLPSLTTSPRPNNVHAQVQMKLSPRKPELGFSSVHARIPSRDRPVTTAAEANPQTSFAGFVAKPMEENNQAQLEAHPVERTNSNGNLIVNIIPPASPSVLRKADPLASSVASTHDPNLQSGDDRMFGELAALASLSSLRQPSLHMTSSLANQPPALSSQLRSSLSMSPISFALSPSPIPAEFSSSAE